MTPQATTHEPTGALDAGALFRRHAPYVVRFLSKLGVADAHIEDLVQEVFMTAHRRGGYQPGPARPTTWLAEIALRVTSTHRRTLRRRRVEADQDRVERTGAATGDPSRKVETARAFDRVSQVLDAMDLDHRAVFVLYELEGKSCAEIAAALELPVGTVYSRLHNARKRFTEAHGKIMSHKAQETR